jgi:hypothetical protein
MLQIQLKTVLSFKLNYWCVVPTLSSTYDYNIMTKQLDIIFKTCNNHNQGPIVDATFSRGIDYSLQLFT